MTEERIIRTENPDGTTSTTHTTVISDRSEGGGAGKYIFLLILVLGLIVGAYFLSQTSGVEIAKDNAITEAANEVGEAANQVGDAAQDAGEAVSDAAQKANPAR
ncbi:hypothetical protein LY632_09450 [Erythrobacter sp. SDW2]|uniref:hypothetical protein n=1 Tax=Erythrobacter sp. SDW2 TaxID=2907154 RepID=UPI001F4352E5|nr:hypothetical protein [Erythrobacter sp. SDW2]UIP05928.1 hypothetical protein LY632_09450 [Erythrobacter sp. SDW2]